MKIFQNFYLKILNLAFVNKEQREDMELRLIVYIRI